MADEGILLPGDAYDFYFGKWLYDQGMGFLEEHINQKTIPWTTHLEKITTVTFKRPQNRRNAQISEDEVFKFCTSPTSKYLQKPHKAFAITFFSYKP